MTTPPKDLSLDEAAFKEVLKPDGSIGHCPECFKAGAAYQAGVDEKRAQVLVEALKAIKENNMHNRQYCARKAEQALATYKSKGTDHE